MTHYIPAFTVVFRGKTARFQRAVCGEMVENADHANEPACVECKAWLEQDADNTAENMFGNPDEAHR